MTFIKTQLDYILRFFNYEEQFDLDKQDCEDFKALNAQQMEFAKEFKSEFAINAGFNIRSKKDT